MINGAGIIDYVVWLGMLENRTHSLEYNDLRYQIVENLI